MWAYYTQLPDLQPHSDYFRKLLDLDLYDGWGEAGWKVVSSTAERDVVSFTIPGFDKNEIKVNQGNRQKPCGFCEVKGKREKSVFKNHTAWSTT